jgi:CBS domain-containing protein
VTDDGILVGLVSEHELRFELEDHERGRDQALSEVMVTDLVTIGPDEDLTVAADSMIEHRLSALPVVRGDGLVGLLTDRAVIQHFTAKFRLPAI